MKIKRLEIHGFKSFADRTVLSFGDGITGVLGPNGCGKSNIVDALRWCMGEQSAKHLRGGAMDDIIFAGSDSRGEMGMAEVSIVFKNDGHNVPADYKDHAEISITRQLFRDGTSNYLINKVPCRLRDINELFLGTGIGRNSYAIIEQGRIGMVVTSKPDDRRALIEDAAGISKYKFRRRQAERKLDATQHNLLRVSDIVTELKKRIGSLERQAKKAEKYKLIKTELKELELCAAVHRHLELSSLAQEARSVVSGTGHKIGDQEERLLQEETRIESAKDDLAAREQDLRSRGTRLNELEQTLAVGKKNVEHLKRELEGIRTRLAEAEIEQDTLQNQIVEAQDEREELAYTAETLGQTEDSEALTLQDELRALIEFEANVDALDHALEQEKQNLIQCLTQVAQHQAEFENLQTMRDKLQAQISKLDTEAGAATTLAQDTHTKGVEAETKLNANRQLKLDLEDQSAVQKSQLERYQAEYVQNETQLLGHREGLMDHRSRLNSLQTIRRNYEGCADGVRAVMKRRTEEEEASAEQLHGLVADVLNAEQRYETAVEAVLGERLQYVIVNSQTEGVESIDYLRGASHGRSSFIPLDLREDHVSWAPRNSSRPPESISDLPPPEEIQQAAREAQAALLEKPKTDDVAMASSLSILPHPEAVWAYGDEGIDIWPDLDASGVCGKLIDLVAAKPGFEHVARVLLGDVVIVEDLQSAQDLWRNNGHRKTLVTLDGVVLDPVGVITGGSTEGIATGMLAQKREIEELEGIVHSLEAKVKMDDERQKALKLQITNIEKRLNVISSSKHEEDLMIVRLEKDIRTLKETAEIHNRRAEQIKMEQDSLAVEQVSLLQGIEASDTKRAALIRQQSEAEGRIAEQGETRSVAKTQTQNKAAEVTNLKIKVAANNEKRENSKRSVSRIDALVFELQSRIERLKSNIESSHAEVGILEESITNANSEDVDIGAQADDRRDELQRINDVYQSDSTQLREEESLVRIKRSEINELRTTLNDGSIRLREYEVSLDALHEQIEDRYQIPLLEVVTDHHLSAIQSDDTQNRRDDLRKKVERMGEINLTAIREFAEVKERYDFLNGQQEDLNSAIAQLRAAIKKIDVTSKARFLKAFDLVKEKFEVVFPRLFNGGHATLKITDPSNPLESGIELMAQPPGKKLQNVSLLSGGEKALTAISLIFSIFLIKPTPFCLLDEVDAPLDDANVGRYNDMVRDMAQLSQFILITHNKRTMEIPDRLYGVTMEEPGISKLVGVDLKKRKQKVLPEAS